MPPLRARPDLDFSALVGNNPAMSMALNATVQPLIGSYLGSQYLPAQFVPTANLYDQFRQKADIQNQRAAAAAGMARDREVYQRMIEGTVAAATGQKLTESQRAAAATAAGDFTLVSPFIAATAPDMFDQMHGRRGSAYLFGQQVGSAGRYRVDPVTGAQGYSTESATAITQQVYERLYGPNADIRAMRGIGAGQAGLMFDELTKRGVIGGATDRVSALKQLASESGKTTDEIEKLPDLNVKLQKLESGRVADRLKEMTGAVTAVREMFGEAGRPDAPMAELISALNAMTQGGLGSMDPKQMEQTVRNAANAARSAGTDIRGVMQLSATLAPQARSLGLSPQAAVLASTEGLRYAAAFGQAYGGLAVSGVDKERAALVGATLSLNAEVSPQANRLAALRKLGRELKAFDAEGESDAARLVRAVERGEDEYVDSTGRRRSVALMPGDGEGSVNELMRRSGFDDKQKALFFQTIGNASALGEHRRAVSPVVRRLQGQLDIAPRMQQSMSSTLRSLTESKNIDDSLAGNIDTAALAKSIMDMTPEEQMKFAKDGGDTTNVQKLIEKQLKEKGVNVTDAQRKQINTFAVLARDSMISYFQADPGTAGYSSDPRGRLAGALAMTSRRTVDQTLVAKSVHEVESQLQSELSQLGQASPVQRLADRMYKADEKTTLKEILADVFGFVNKDEVEKLSGGALGDIYKEVNEAKQTSPDAVKARVKELMSKGTPEAQEELRKLERIYGVSASQIGSLSEKDIRTRRLSSALETVKRTLPTAKAQLDSLEAKYQDEMKKTAPDAKTGSTSTSFGTASKADQDPTTVAEGNRLAREVVTAAKTEQAAVGDDNKARAAAGAKKAQQAFDEWTDRNRVSPTFFDGSGDEDLKLAGTRIAERSRQLRERLGGGKDPAQVGAPSKKDAVEVKFPPELKIVVTGKVDLKTGELVLHSVK